jgi:hypothetical protein
MAGVIEVIARKGLTPIVQDPDETPVGEIARQLSEAIGHLAYYAGWP